MARCVLLNLDDPFFDFEHWMEHRGALGVMAPLNRFSVIPYFIAPRSGGPSGSWALDHQRAHDDAMQNLPTYFGAPTRGLYIGKDLKEWDLSDPRQASTWTFDNHQEHYVGGSTILPNVYLPPPAPTWTYPFF